MFFFSPPQFCEIEKLGKLCTLSNLHENFLFLIRVVKSFFYLGFKISAVSLLGRGIAVLSRLRFGALVFLSDSCRDDASWWCSVFGEIVVVTRTLCMFFWFCL